MRIVSDSRELEFLSIGEKNTRSPKGCRRSISVIEMLRQLKLDSRGPRNGCGPPCNEVPQWGVARKKASHNCHASLCCRCVTIFCVMNGQRPRRNSGGNSRKLYACSLQPSYDF